MKWFSETSLFFLCAIFKTHFLFKRKYFDKADGLSVKSPLDLINGKYFHTSLQKNIAVRRKPPQSFVLQTMICLKNSVMVCHFWHHNQKFTVEHKKDCVDYGASYTSVTTRTFQTWKRGFWNRYKICNFQTFAKREKLQTSPRPYWLSILYKAVTLYQLEIKEIVFIRKDQPHFNRQVKSLQVMWSEVMPMKRCVFI